MPEIVWDQYTNSLGNFEREFKNRKRHTRRVKLVFDKGKKLHDKNLNREISGSLALIILYMVFFLVGLPARPKSPLDPKKDGESLSYSMLPLSDGPEGSNSRPQVNSIKLWSRKI